MIYTVFYIFLSVYVIFIYFHLYMWYLLYFCLSIYMILILFIWSDIYDINFIYLFIYLCYLAIHSFWGQPLWIAKNKCLRCTVQTNVRYIIPVYIQYSIYSMCIDWLIYNVDIDRSYIFLYIVESIYIRSCFCVFICFLFITTKIDKYEHEYNDE